MYKNFIKPAIDFVLALVGFLFLSPVFVLVTIGLFFANDGKPFFFQLRPGKDGKIFKIIKFKTMTDKKDENGNLLPDADRLTKIGSFVRKTSLDEIPQLLNVIKGEVKPGITGWAQVNGRNSISWEKKFEYDVWYVDNVSFLLDVKILILTVLKVVKSEGINEQGQATSNEFKGNNIE